MRSPQEIYGEIRNLVLKVEHSSPRLFNFGLSYSFTTKIKCLEIMQKSTLEKIQELFKAYEKEKENSVCLNDTSRLLDESIAFFEGYLNAFYSFLQIIAKMTPCFYDKRELKCKLPDHNFERQTMVFLNNPTIDSEYTDYLKNNMTWYHELMNNRNAITHNVSAFLGFDKKEIVFIHMPRKRIDFFENGKPTKKLEKYVSSNWNSLFEFLDFYVEHFSAREIFVDKEDESRQIAKEFKGKQT